MSGSPGPINSGDARKLNRRRACLCDCVYGSRARLTPPREWAERFFNVQRWTETNGAGAQLVNLYGPSETTMTKLFYLVQPGDAGRESIPIGKPMPGTRAVVLDGKGRPCAPGVVGEIYIRTPYRALGYFNRPDLDREVFVPNPLTGNPDDIVYRTGDFGRVLDKRLTEEMPSIYWSC